MTELLDLINIFLPFAYLGVVLIYLVYFLKKSGWSQTIATPAARGVTALHGLYLLSSTIVYRHVFLGDVWEAFCFVAFTLAVVYLVLEWRLKDKATGVFLMAFPFLFQTLSSANLTRTEPVNPILKSSWFGLHVSAALLGYAGFTIAAVYGILYLLLYRQLKGSRVGLIFQRLPNLEVLSRLNLSALMIGWGTLTLGIVVGIFWSMGLYTTGEIVNDPLTDPKFISTTSVWILYGLCVSGRYLMRWPSRVLAYVSLAAFVLMLMSSFAVDLFFKSFHSFT